MVVGRMGREMGSKLPIVITEVRDRDSTRFGRKYEGSVLKDTVVEIEPGKSITIMRVVAHGPEEGQLVTKKFEIGDTAEVGSFNLVYTGKIRKITDKTITVVEYENSSQPRTYRFSIYNFASRNWDFDADEAARRNHETMLYI